MRANEMQYQEPITDEEMEMMQPDPDFIPVLGRLSQQIAGDVIEAWLEATGGKNKPLPKDMQLTAVGFQTPRGDMVPIFVFGVPEPKALPERILFAEFDPVTKQIGVFMNGASLPEDLQNGALWLHLADFIAHEYGHYMTISEGEAEEVPDYHWEGDKKIVGRLRGHRYLHNRKEMLARGFSTFAMITLVGTTMLMHGDDVPDSSKEWDEFLREHPAWLQAQDEFDESNLKRLRKAVIDYATKNIPLILKAFNRARGQGRSRK